MKYRPSPPPLDIDERVGRYLNDELWRMWEAVNGVHDHDVLYTLPQTVAPGMVRWFADYSEWPDPNDGGNQNRNGTNDGNGPGPNNGGSGGAAGLYEYVSYDMGWQKL